MKKTTWIILLVTGAVLTATFAFGWPGGHGSGWGQDCGKRGGQQMTTEQRQQRHAQHLEKMAVILDLSAEQKEEIATLQGQRQEERQALKTELEASREKLHSAGDAENFDEAQYRALAAEHADLKTRMLANRAATRQQIAAVLTPQQREKAEKLGAMHGEGQGCMGGAGQGCMGGEGRRCGGAGEGKGRRHMA
jgi:Spy/CpxP family protein refolding chaperone